MTPRILVLNPGSTSTKISLYDGEAETFAQTLRHSADELAAYDTITDQAPMRRAAIDTFLSDHSITTLDAVVARGGLLRPVTGGVYQVDEAMVCDLRSAKYGAHASNLGAVLACDLALAQGCPAYIADPVVVDELDDVARISGIPQIDRRSIFHALNQKSAAREVCRAIGTTYEAANLIVAHLGGGISVGAHAHGRVVDVNNALDGDGPFSPERAGTLPAGQLAELVAQGDYELSAIKRLLTGGGGIVAHLGTNDVASLVTVAGWQADTAFNETPQDSSIDPRKADLILRAMCYQIAKAIAQYGATLSGKVDAIVLTGGIAHNQQIVDAIAERVSFLGPVHVIPGEREMVSLAAAASGALDGSRKILRYGP